MLTSSSCHRPFLSLSYFPRESLLYKFLSFSNSPTSHSLTLHTIYNTLIKLSTQQWTTTTQPIHHLLQPPTTSPPSHPPHQSALRAVPSFVRHATRSTKVCVSAGPLVGGCARSASRIPSRGYGLELSRSLRWLPGPMTWPPLSCGVLRHV